MSIEIERSERDYAAKLVERCRQWEAAHPTDAAIVRKETLTKIGMHVEPPMEGIRRMVLENAVREAIRERNKWPTCEQWLKGAK
jgi:hypothetical protein